MVQEPVTNVCASYENFVQWKRSQLEIFSFKSQFWTFLLGIQRPSICIMTA